MTTPSAIKRSPLFRSALELTDLNFSIYFTHAIGEQVEYKAFFNNQLLFAANDYKPYPCYEKYSLDALVILLDRLTRKPGNTGAVNGKIYDQQQLKWSDSPECKKLARLVNDYDQDKKKAHKYFREHFINHKMLDHYPYIFSLDNVVCHSVRHHEKGWQRVDIQLTQQQKDNFLKKFGFGCRINTWEKLKKAAQDNFSRLKSDGILKCITFRDNEVIFCPAQDHYKDVNYLRKLITKSY